MFECRKANLIPLIRTKSNCEHQQLCVETYMFQGLKSLKGHCQNVSVNGHRSSGTSRLRFVHNRKSNNHYLRMPQYKLDN